MYSGSNFLMVPALPVSRSHDVDIRQNQRSRYTLKSTVIVHGLQFRRWQYGSIFIRLAAVNCLPNLRNHPKFRENSDL